MTEEYRYIPKRTDKNQPDIVRTLRRLGFVVKSLHETGGGVFDLLITKHRLTINAEVKDGSKPPSRRELTPAQKQFNFEWPGLKCVLINNEDCLRLNVSVNRIGHLLHQNGIEILIEGNGEEQYKPSLY